MLKTIYGRIAIVGLLIAPAVYATVATARANFSGKSLIAETTLPERIGTWTGSLEPLTDTEKNILHTPAASQRIYVDQVTGNVAQILIIQIENTQNAHDPRLCMAGSGYVETSSKEEAAPWVGPGPRNLVSHSVFSKEGENLHMYYWMSTKNGTIANMSTGLKLEGMWRAISGEPTKGFAIRVLGRPNRFNESESPAPEVLQKLWRQISERIRLEDLVKQQ